MEVKLEMIDLSKYISATEAGERLGISRVRVVQLIAGKRLPAVKAGRDWLIDPADLKLVAHRPVGRPAGSKGSKTKKASKKKG
jgi:excisionase family DNA binding protein